MTSLNDIQDLYASKLAEAAVRENAAARRAGYIRHTGRPWSADRDQFTQYRDRAAQEILDALQSGPLCQVELIPLVRGNKSLLASTLRIMVAEGKITKDQRRTGKKYLYRLPTRKLDASAQPV